MSKAIGKKAPKKRKRANEILLTLTGDVGKWLEEQAKKRGLLNKRGGLQSLIQEKLFAQMRTELAPLASSATE